MLLGGKGNISLGLQPARFPLPNFPVFPGATWSYRTVHHFPAGTLLLYVGARTSTNYINLGLGKSRLFVASRSSGSSPNGYFLFRFLDNGNPLYGWAQLSVSFGHGTSPDAYRLVDYAYDTTGAKIGAGELPSVPEPAETIPLALSALVLGAAGVRRWRAAKTS
jgi:hypothetical protein